MVDDVQADALVRMEHWFRHLEAMVPPPQAVPFRGSLVLRFTEKSIHQAVVLKLARVVSGLHAARLLMTQGFVQEQALLHRTIDELGEDVIFLASAIANGPPTALHEQYLEAFWAEPIPAEGEIVGNVSKPNVPPRRKIHAEIQRALGGAAEPTRAVATMKALHTTYSGYVHGAAANIMDLCGGSPPRFHVRGMTGTPREAEHLNDSWNYVYRSLVAFAFALEAFGDRDRFNQVGAFMQHFQTQSGRDFGLAL